MKRILTISLLVTIGLVLIMSCGRMPDERLMENGKKLEEKEKFAEAIESYEKLVKLYDRSPFCAEALYRAGLAYTNGLQDFSKAISSFQKVVKEYSDNKYAAQSQFMIGFIYANNISDSAEARIAYNTFIEQYPDHELVPSVKWELKYLGKDINSIPELQTMENPKEVGEKK